MTYDVIAVNQARKDRPLLSVRVVSVHSTKELAQVKHRQMQRSVEFCKIDGEEFFAIVPHRMYRDGEKWVGTKNEESV